MSVDTSKTTIRTSLKRVRGLGSAHHGTSDFFRQRLTAIAMILLFVPVIVVILSLLGRNQAGDRIDAPFFAFRQDFAQHAGCPHPQQRPARIGRRKQLLQLGPDPLGRQCR